VIYVTDSPLRIRRSWIHERVDDTRVGAATRASGLGGIEMEGRLSPDRILDIGLGFWPSKGLLSAVDLDIFSQFQSDPLELGTLAGRIDILEDGAQDLMEALVAIELLNCDADGRDVNPAAPALSLDYGSPPCVGGQSGPANRAIYRPWGSLTEALRRSSILVERSRPMTVATR
jgi:hypothetical protein